MYAAPETPLRFSPLPPAPLHRTCLFHLLHAVRSLFQTVFFTDVGTLPPSG